MNTQLSIAIEHAEVFSESRAILDHGIHGRRVDEWIESHEALRRKARLLHRQNAELQRQLVKLQKEALK